MSAPAIERYAWGGGEETMLRFGPAAGPVVVLALPLFEEANRTRAFAVTLLRALADRGIGGALPDLPGTGESLIPTSDLDLLHLRQAFEAAVEHVWAQRRAFAVALRSGALLDTLPLVTGRWHFAPQNGANLVRELSRIAPLADETEAVVEIAGNRLPRDFLAALGGAAPIEADDGAAMRVVRLDTDPRPADRKIAAKPLWRRSEPDNDLELVELLGDDIAQWIATCAG
ncbi:MAG TPA: hypothetical protein VM900_12460 [Sphingomonas sp.]|nr:hypothetical protein [Sphingomonas sp.]